MVYAAVPAVRTLIHELRELDCRDSRCRYCAQQHPESLLLQFFHKPGFRARPAAPDGRSLQRQLVVAGLEDEKELLRIHRAIDYRDRPTWLKLGRLLADVWDGTSERRRRDRRRSERRSAVRNPS